MRRAIVLLGCVSVLLVVIAPCAAQQQEPSTKFERFMLRKGRVGVREYYPVGELGGRLGAATFQIARAYTPGQRDYLLALRIEVTEPSGRFERQHTGVLDAEEVASLATALPQMARMTKILQQSHIAANTEIDFKAGSIQMTSFVADKSSGFAIKVGEISSATAFFELTDFDRLAELVNQAVAKIRELENPSGGRQ